MKNQTFRAFCSSVSLAAFALTGSILWATDVTMRPDGEVKTISAALEKVRALRASGAIPAGRIAEVSVEPGRYPVTEAAVFKPADSNVRIVAVKAGRAVFDGGVALPPFVAGADGLWRARVPVGLAFEQLYVNGCRAQRARTPNEFYLYMREQYDGETNPLTGKSEDLSRRAFIVKPSDVVQLAALTPDELARAELLFWQSWDMGRSRIEHVDANTGLVLLRQGASRPLFFWSSTCPRYALENYRGALDAPGEWFHDVKAGELLYVPRPGERPETTTAIAPVASGFAVFAGDPLSDALVRNVVFEGLAFEHAAWRLPGDGVKNAQSAQNIRDAAILGDGVRGFVMENCRISHVGMHGVWLKRGCRDCRIVRCLVEDLGGGGVCLGDTGGWQEDGPARVTAFNCVSNCIVRTGGLALNGAIGVWIGHSSDNEIVHNDIGDFRYTGVSMGWTWGYSPTVAKRNRLTWNRIHHIGWGVLSDMGGVYTLGNSEGTVEIGNWIHDVNGYAGNGSPAWGLYTDEGSAGILLASNLVERCRDGAVHQHYGKDNTFANNIFVTFERSGVWRSRVENHTTIIVTNNVFWWTNSASQVIRGGKSGKSVTDLVMDGNLFWCAGGISSNAFFGQSLEAWRTDGHDRASQVCDPLFRDPLRGDWRLAPESPALKMGFVPWDWTEAGVPKGDAAWRAEAMDDTRYPPLKDAPPAPRFFRARGSIDFEAFKPGTTGRKKLSFFQVYGEKGVTVTDETAASGKNSLRLADSPKHAANWEPHLIANIGAEEGSVRIRWSFRTDATAHPQFECRDYKQDGVRPYAIGPSVTFAAGHVRAGGRAVADVPVDAWCRMEIVLHVTGPKAGTWSCTVTPPDGEPKTVDGIKVQSGFRALDWNGFMTNGKEGVWFLDDFSVEPVHGFTLVSREARARVVVGEGEPGFVLRAAQDLTNDVRKITGVGLELVRGNAPRAGDMFVATKPRAEWEAYDVTIRDGVLAVEGSDARGTMFGLYDFIERYLKVDPLAFWNGTPYPKADTLAWGAVEIRQASPTFRFRGWFINDEDLLTAWMPSGGKRYIDYPFYSDVVNPAVMEHVAEALVRCRYNLIIPASFINIMNPPEAKLVDICAARGVYLSMHHVEPMGVSAFTFFKYWKDRGKNLKYSYYSNPREIEEVWRAAAERWAKYPNVIWQIGLRGIADRPMWRADPDTPTDDAARAAIISSAMAKQVSILDEVGVPKEGRLVSTTLWAEGSVFNQKGLLTIPDGTIVVFADNCAGWKWPPDFHQTARLDRYRYGVYYHHGLIGSGPHLASLVPAVKTYDMMRQAREKGSSTYAIFNVSDIREFVYGIDATAKMLWNLDAFDPEEWTKDWLARHYSARRDDWLAAYNTYYHALALHPTSGHPVFLDGLLQNRGRNMIRQMLKENGRSPRIAAEPFLRSYEPKKGKDAFYEALAAVVGPPIDNPRDAYARLASQTATYTLAAELARGLYAGLPADEREFAFTTLVYPAELMRDLSDWCGEIIRTHESQALGDRASARAHAEAALARIDAILARAADYCAGQWENWYRDCRKINLKGLREQTSVLLGKLK